MINTTSKRFDLTTICFEQ